MVKQAQRSLTPQTFRISGMDCADCAKTIERGVAKLNGVQSCTLNYTAATLKVDGDVDRVGVIKRVRDLGYDVREDVARTNSSAASRLPSSSTGVLGFVRYLLQRRDTALAVVGAILILPGLIFKELLPMLNIDSPVLTISALAALIVAGLPVARGAWRALRVNHEIGINALMVIAAIGAVVIGAYTEAGLVMVLFAIGEALEGYTMARARDSISTLMQVAPNEATVLRPCIDCKEHLGQDGYSSGACPFCGVEETRVFVDDLRVGDTIVVKPGERIAMDGRISAGASSVNQAPITGESVPVTKSSGSEVFAGSINGEGALEVVVTKLAQDNTLNRIIRLVEEAQDNKAPAERFVDQFAKYYTPIVVIIAVLVAAIPPLLFNASFWGDPATGAQDGWLYRALELLVVACPCALVISTPVTLVSAISNAAHNGVLIKGGAYLEMLATVKAIAFDKTGTLTEGKPSVMKVQSVNCEHTPNHECGPCEELLAMASSVERRSDHPMARAIVAEATRQNLIERYPAADNVMSITGKGVIGELHGHKVLVGSHAHFDSTVPHPREQCDAATAQSVQGTTPLMVSIDGNYKGYIAVTDAVRDSSRRALADLKRVGVSTLVMLTGDNIATAQRVAQDVGVTDVRAELLPENKVAALKGLLTQHAHVAMVGDGVNDAPALATASVGIAMGACGTAQAMETADIVLMTDDLSKLPFAIQLSRAAMRTIRYNIALSIGVKVLFFFVVLLGFGSMWLAVLADVGTSLLVTLNAMRLLKYGHSR